VASITSRCAYLSQLTDLFRQASDLRVGDAAGVLVGHVVDQGVHLSGQVPGTGNTHQDCHNKSPVDILYLCSLGVLQQCDEAQLNVEFFLDAI